MSKESKRILATLKNMDHKAFWKSVLSKVAIESDKNERVRTASRFSIGR